jgi:hypothetical protein
MTSEESRFIELWNAGVETAAIAQALGIKATTAQSRARRLQARGLIEPRQRGGNYPVERAKARQGNPPSTLDQCRHQCRPPISVQCPVSTPVQCSPSTLDQCSAWTPLNRRSRASDCSCSPSSTASTTHQCRHRCRSVPCPRIPRARPCAGTSGSWKPSRTRSAPWPPSGTCRPASWCKRSSGRR